MAGGSNGTTRTWAIGTLTAVALAYFGWMGKTLFDVSKDTARTAGALPGIQTDIANLHDQQLRDRPALAKVERVDQAVADAQTRLDRLERYQDRRWTAPSPP